MLQIVFNEISAAEISRLDTLLQLELLAEFKVTAQDLARIDRGEPSPGFGLMQREGGKKLYRYRAKDYRIYFTAQENSALVLRVLHKNTLKDFLLRNNLPGAEDEALSQSKTFWKLIDESKIARS